MNEQDLMDFVVDRATEHWRDNQSPYFLTSIATELVRDKDVDYKSILGKEKLKEFVLRLQDRGQIKLVQDPDRKPRVGVVPSEVNFEFEPSEPRFNRERRPAENRSDRSGATAKNPQLLLEFLRMLGSLPDDLVSEVVIPTKVLVALATRQ